MLVNKRFIENENAVEQALIKKSYALKSDVSLANFFSSRRPSHDPALSEVNATVVASVCVVT